jgi:hypothetical protein
LGNAAAFGSAGEIALLAERQEIADLMHLHVDPDTFGLPRHQDGIAVDYRG